MGGPLPKMRGMNTLKITKAIALGAVLTAGWGCAIGAEAKAGGQAPPPMGEQFTSQTSTPLKDGPLASDLAQADRKARAECEGRLVEPLIAACVKKVQEREAKKSR